MNNEYREIQELLQQRADLHARLKLLPYDGSPEVKNRGEGKYLYIRKRVAGKLTSKYVDLYSDELYDALLRYAKEGRELRKELRRAENFQKIYNENEEWSSFPAMLLVVRADFVKENRELVRKTGEVYKSAIQWTVKNPSKAAILAEKHNIGLSEDVVKQSVPNAVLIWRDAKAAKADIEKYLLILKRELPDEGFYF